MAVPITYLHPGYGLYRLHTSAQDETDEAKEHKWLSILTELQYFKFQVQACDSGHVALASRPGDTTSLHYELVLGKTQYGIKDLRTGQYVQQVDGVKLDCDNYKAFWMSWDDGNLNAGEGTRVGSNQLLSHPDENITSITNAVSVTTGRNVEGFWEIHRDMGRLHTVKIQPPVQIPEKPVYDYFWINLESYYVMIFQVKMCSEARINVSPTRYSTEGSTEIRIGFNENTRTGVYNFTNGHMIEEVDTPGVLSCDEFRYFWFHRSNGYYEFGLGSHIGSNRLFYFPGADPFLNLAFDSLDPAGGAYQFKHLEGDYFTIFTDYDQRMLTDVFMTTQNEYIEFWVRGCAGAVVAIVTANTQEEQNEYFIVIGASNNQQTTVQQRQDNEGFLILKISESPDILSCDAARLFWITWDENTFRVGRGLLYSGEYVLEWTADNDTLSPVQGLSITTDDQVNIAEWRINRHAVSTLVSRTQSGQFDHLWYDASALEKFVFTIRFCSDAVFVLSEFHGVYDYHSYKVQIGPNGEYKVVLTKAGGSDPVEGSLQTDLNCDVPQLYWVQWVKTGTNNDLQISMGHGPDVDNYAILEYVDSSPYQINTVAITSENSKVADWTFSKIEDNSLVITTDPFYGYNYGFLALSSQWFKVQVQACSDACIMLSSNTDHMDMEQGPSVEICLGVDRNTRTSAQDISSGDEPLGMMTPNILSCFSLRSYWLEWNSNNVTIGQADLHSYPVLVFPAGEGKAFNFRFIKFSTANEVRGLYRVPYESHGLVNMETSGLDAVPVLPFTETKDHNTHPLPSTHQRPSKSNSQEPGTPNLRVPDFDHNSQPLSSDHLRPGKASSHDPKIPESFDQNNKPLSSRHLHPGKSSSQVAGVLGKASSQVAGVLGKASGQVAGVPDLRLPSFGRYWITSVSRQHVIFRVKACQEAYVALSPQYGGYKFFEVRFGVRNNSYMEIVGTQQTVSLPTTDALSCNEYRNFWISWRVGRIAVGTGRIPEDNFLFAYSRLEEDYGIHALAFATAKGFNGSWEIAQYDADHYLVRTLPSESVPVEVHTRSQVFLFSVMTCCEAQIKLHKNDQDTYTVILGAESGKRVKLLKRDTEVNSMANLGFVTCSQQNDFWLTWNQNTIRIGKGMQLYNQLVLDWIDADEGDRFTEDVTSVRLSSTQCETEVHWTYPKHMGNATVYHSPENADYYGLRMMTRSVTSAVFRVKTCNQAQITLSDIPGIITERTLEVVIENGISRLRRGVGGEELELFTTQGDSLDCDHYRPFWISWKNNAIEIGAGTSVGDQRFIVYYLPDSSFTVNCLAFSTGSSPGTWMFSLFSGNIYHAHTTPEFSHNLLHTQVWLANPRMFLEFAVKGEKEARIALAYIPQDVTRSTYEVILGADNNQNSMIYYTDSSGAVKENTRAETPGILDKTQYNSFWVHWDNLRIRVGRGQLFSGQFLSLEGTTFFEVNALSLSSGNTTKGDWTFVQDNDDSIYVQTREYYESPDFSLTVADRNYFVFQVKSCEHAEILLSSQMGNEKTNAYQVIIGRDRNQESVIKSSPDSSEEHTIDTPNLLSCTEHRTFWVSWRNALISFGSGPRVEENLIHSWQDPSEPSRDVIQAYLNTGDQDIGYYELVDLDGESYTVVTGGDHSYEFVSVTPQKTHLAFRVKACSDVHVALKREDGNIEYEVVFGCCGNTKTVIRNESLTYNVASKETPELLSCSEMRTLWVSWDNGAIVVGIGAVYTHRLVEYLLPDSPNVHTLSLSTWGGIKGEFKFSETMASQIDLRSRDLGSNAYSQFWRTLQGRTYFTFRVKARHSVHVILTNVPSVTDAKAYEVKIGVNANTETMIAKRQGTTVINMTEGILAETEMRDFWVSWYGGKIGFGKGIAIGENEVSSLMDSEYNINAFSLAIEMGIPAQWEFTSDIIEPSTTPTTPSPSTSSWVPGETSSTTTTSSTASSTRGPDEGEPEGNEGLSAGAIVGIVFGVLGFLMIIALALLLLVRLRQIKNYKEFMNEDETGESRGGISWDNPNYETTPTDIQLRDDPFRTGTGIPSDSVY